MKSKFLTFLFTILVSTSFILPKSEAAIGVIVKKRAIRSFGSMAIKYGSRTLLVGLLSTVPLCIIECKSLPLIAVTVSYYGFLGAIFGLAVLDDKTIVGIDFLPITEFHPDFDKYTEEEILTFNNEIDELNAIKNTLDEELADIDDYQKVGPKLWEKYSEVLDPITIKIAQEQASKLFQNLNSI